MIVNNMQNTKLCMDGFFIAVLDSGFVYVGEVTQYENGYLMREVKNIRRWGTTKGLGQLALDGPTKDTVLDEVGSILVPLASVKHFIITDKGKWS